MPELAMFRAVHTIWAPAHTPHKSLTLDARALATLVLCDVPVERAFSRESLTELRRGLESHRALFHGNAVRDFCRTRGLAAVTPEMRPALAACLSEDPRLRVLAEVLDFLRQAEQGQMTVVLSADPHAT